MVAWIKQAVFGVLLGTMVSMAAAEAAETGITIRIQSTPALAVFFAKQEVDPQTLAQVSGKVVVVLWGEKGIRCQQPGANGWKPADHQGVLEPAPDSRVVVLGL